MPGGTERDGESSSYASYAGIAGKHNSVDSLRAAALHRALPQSCLSCDGTEKSEKIVKEEGSRGSISDADMLKYISDAASGIGVFNTAFMADNLSEAVLSKLYSYGYIPEPEVRKLLKMDKMFVSSFWEDIAKKSC